jgi:hypothetical protein
MSQPPLSLVLGALCASGALAGGAAAQSIYVDFGSAGSAFGLGPPSPAYGAAAGVPGQWNDVDTAPMLGLGNYVVPNVLFDTGGVATGVGMAFDVLNAGNTFTSLSSNQANTFGDDELLMDDIVYCVGEPYTITISGLAPGPYDVYTYAMAPDSITLFSLVDVPAGTGGAQVVGGDFPLTGHALGVTYSLHSATVAPGGTLEILMASNASDDSLNGLQIVSGSGGGVGLGAQICNPAVVNSTGASAEILVTGNDDQANGPYALNLFASNLPPSQFGYFLAGKHAGFIPNPGGSQGNLCIGSPQLRITPSLANSGAAGSMAWIVDVNNVDSLGSGTVGVDVVSPGETWRFQCWYRDMNPGSTSNFTDATVITFQ